QAKAIVLGQDKELAEHYKDDLKDYKAELKRLNDAHKIATTEQERLKTAIPNYENYLELFDNVASLLRSTKSIMVFNKILEKFVSNLVLEGELVPPKTRVPDGKWSI